MGDGGHANCSRQIVLSTEVASIPLVVDAMSQDSLEIERLIPAKEFIHGIAWAAYLGLGVSQGSEFPAYKANTMTRRQRKRDLLSVIVANLTVVLAELKSHRINFTSCDVRIRMDPNPLSAESSSSWVHHMFGTFPAARKGAMMFRSA